MGLPPKYLGYGSPRLMRNPSPTHVASRWLRATVSLRPGDNFLWFDRGSFEKAELGGTPPGVVSLHVSVRKKIVDVENRSKFAPESREALLAFQRDYGDDWTVTFDGSREGLLNEFLGGGDDTVERTPTVHKWYHGTSASSFDNILRRGLRPRGSGGAVFVGGSGESNPLYVYLASDDGNDVRFAARAAGTVTKSQPIILEINGRALDPDLLRPDEDSGELTWVDSLRKIGNVAYEGIIPPSAIKVHLLLTDSGWDKL